MEPTATAVEAAAAMLSRLPSAAFALLDVDAARCNQDSQLASLQSRRSQWNTKGFGRSDIISNNRLAMFPTPSSSAVGGIGRVGFVPSQN